MSPIKKAGNAETSPAELISNAASMTRFRRPVSFKMTEEEVCSSVIKEHKT